ncbi:MAG: Ig-like domain-containing protein [Deltaproteobacteria bacterium]|nr:Ig-like domain-containing protein [Deltaproteobacteria bacterium]MBW2172282.1 Ig-like domain-containing protein [Deltaproteobacteria bacterium]
MKFIEKPLYGAIVVLMFPIGIVLMTGCASQPTPISPSVETNLHTYNVIVKDVDGKPIENVEVEYTSKNHTFLQDTGVEYTGTDGTVSIEVKAAPDSKYSYPRSYNTVFEYTAKKEGYYSVRGIMRSRARTWVFEKDYVTLIKPTDYFDQDFISSAEGIELKAKILPTVDLIESQGLSSKALLQKRSIKLLEFKAKRYLSIGFDTVNVYHSLQLNRYDVGKRLFDEIVRKMLGPLNQHISDKRAFYGYNIVIKGRTKSLAGKYAPIEDIMYSFFMPIDAVREYKNKDISGQALLDRSIILIDDERVEFRLQ